MKNEGFNVKESGEGEEIDYITVSGSGGTTYFTKKDTVTITKKEKEAEVRKTQAPPSSKRKIPHGPGGPTL